MVTKWVRAAGVVMALVAAACSGKPESPGAGGAQKVAAGLHFIENDAPQALADAKSRNVPVFVEAWAPW